ncbi:MAG: dihydroorotate dehydrogenase electron transfer subunit [Clostridia bacterium]|nr:dihydroorotate dehydrogenase electron transfer subunit [Clostridia bacterium]
MKQSLFDIVSNKKIARDIYEMVLYGDTSDLVRPGQFINIKLDGLFLRRPISVCDYDDKTITIIYKVVGEGTEKMSKMDGGKLDILTGLGNGFDIEKSGDKPLLIGGGVGVPPMFNLCRKLIENGKDVTVIMGFMSQEDVFYKTEFEKLGAKVYVTTNDGTEGIKGFVTDAMKEIEAYTYFYTCGPEPMLKGVYDASKTSGELSFEARMGCGFGACMGCSCETKYGNKRICKDGPVLKKEEIIW